MALIEGQNTDHSDNAASAPSSDEDFDAAVSEFASESNSDPAHAAADDLPANDKPDGAGEDPAPASAAAPDVPPAGDNTPPEKDTSEDDIWANADPKLREAHENALRDAHLRAEGIKGRQSAADRENARLRAQIAELQGGRESSQAPKEGNDEPGDKPSSEIPDHLRQLREDYPEVAGPLLDVIDKMQGELTELKQPVGALKEREAASAIQQQETLLTEKHPDWQAVATDDRFAGWLEEQPKAIKDAMERNFNAIVDGNDAALVIGKFKADLGIGKEPSTPDPKPDPTVDRRQRQLQAGRDAGRTGPSVTTGIPDDFDSAVDAFMR